MLSDVSKLSEEAEKQTISAAVIGSGEVEFSVPSPAAEQIGEVPQDMEDFSALKSRYYIVDSRTALLPEDVDMQQNEAQRSEPVLRSLHNSAADVGKRGRNERAEYEPY